VKVAKELKKLLDHRMSVEGVGEVSLRGYFPEPLWNKLQHKAEYLAGVEEVIPPIPVTMGEVHALKVKLEKLESRLTTLEHLEQRSADVTREIAKEAVDEIDLDSYVNTYLKDKGYVTDRQFLDLMSRVTDLENSDGFERNVETAMVAVMEEAYKVPEDYTALHRKFHALLKYHFGKLARGQS